jgi:signal transduction histidine kinase
MGSRSGGYWSIAVVGVTAFAFTIATMAGREAAARRALEQTRGDLARVTRDAERLRIARELHDLLGHDLIALHLELETARHLAQGEAKGPVERAHDVAKTLLADVRKAVSSLRDDEGPTDIAEGIRMVIAKVQEPRIHLDAPASLAVTDAERANAVVRSVQEIVTNAIKHASAKNLWITIARENGSIALAAHDDGRGAALVVPGNGLSGMRERLEKLGGEIVFEGERGFRVRAKLPLGRRP